MVSPPSSSVYDLALLCVRYTRYQVYFTPIFLFLFFPWSPPPSSAPSYARPDQDYPRDHMESLLVSCASNPVGTAATGRLPWLATWLQYQPPQVRGWGGEGRGAGLPINSQLWIFRFFDIRYFGISIYGHCDNSIFRHSTVQYSVIRFFYTDISVFRYLIFRCCDNSIYRCFSISDISTLET